MCTLSAVAVHRVDYATRDDSSGFASILALHDDHDGVSSLQLLYIQLSIKSTVIFSPMVSEET